MHHSLGELGTIHKMGDTVFDVHGLTDTLDGVDLPDRMVIGATEEELAATTLVGLDEVEDTLLDLMK